MEAALIKIPETMAIAFLVIAGEYGNGAERKEKLEKDGYDYSTVQSCVNDLLPIIAKYVKSDE